VDNGSAFVGLVGGVTQETFTRSYTDRLTDP
jgi:hypothetical protein